MAAMGLSPYEGNGMNIIECLDSPDLLGAALKSPESFGTWRTVLKSLFGLPMDADEAELFTAYTGREELPTAAFAVMWLVAGRRGGKSFMMALIAAYMGLLRDWKPFLSPGEKAVIALIAADRSQAAVLRNYILGILEIPAFVRSVISTTGDTIELAGSVSIEIMTCNHRTTRGRSVCVLLADETAFWKSEHSQTPDLEVWRAVRASMASFGNVGLAIVASSPYARRGLLFDGWRRYFGKPDASNLVWQLPTWIASPTISDEFLRGELESDPASYAAEYGAHFRSDIEAFVSREVAEASVMSGFFEIAPQSGVTYRGFIDAAGGSGTDSFTMAIAFRQDGETILAAIRERRPPFSPDSVVAEYAELLKSYGIYRATSDKLGSQFVV
jgi:hypothetical protein